MLLAALVVLLLISLNALYVAAEFAAVGSRRARLRRLAEDGNPLAARMLPIVEDAFNLDRYIAVSQIGITLTSLILGAYAQAVVAPRLASLFARIGAAEWAAAPSVAAVVVLLCFTTLQMVLGELVPKSVALQKPTQTALATVIPMGWSLRLFAWAIRVLNGSGTLLLRALRIPATGHRHVHSPDEIALLIAESRDGGLLEPEEQVRLHAALRLGVRTASELMVPRVRLSAIDITTPVDAVLGIAAANPFSRLPVYRRTIDNVVGMLHTKDLVMEYVKGLRIRSLASLVRPIARVRHDMPADELLAFLREHRTHQALVVDAEGRLAGLITLEDVVSELLGDVADEFKAAPAAPPRDGDAT